jgi:hypothetical protein
MAGQRAAATGPAGRPWRRWGAVVALLALAAVSVLIAPRSDAQILPSPPALPPPPAEGNVLADVLGPASATACDAVATVYGLAGPIASAQLPPELQVLVGELDPYLSLITYACGYLVTPPSGVVCAPDDAIAEQAGLLALPVTPPGATKLLYDTAAGIEHALLRLGVDVDAAASRQLAEALGCGTPAPVEAGPPAALPVDERTTAPPSSPAGASGSFGPSAIPDVVAGPTAEQTTVLPGTLGRLGALRYPVRGVAALLLGLPLVLLAAAVAYAPRFARHPRPPRGPAPWDAP